jgi:predicted dehydrogenase
VLLEKPPFATMADLDRMIATAHWLGRAIQVGFQSLGSGAIPAFDADVFNLGDLRSVGATGLWQRGRSYWSRAPWAGRRELNGMPVVDGVVTNPLSHSVTTALRIAGARTREDVRAITTDLYRANDIEADDTSVVRIETVTGLMVTCALTLCAPEEQESIVTVKGARGDATFYHLQDRVVARGVEQRMERVGLLENLIDHRGTASDPGRPARQRIGCVSGRGGNRRMGGTRGRSTSDVPRTRRSVDRSARRLMIWVARLPSRTSKSARVGHDGGSGRC